MKKAMIITLIMLSVLFTGCTNYYEHTTDGTIDGFVECYNAYLSVEKEYHPDNINYTKIEKLCERFTN